MPKSKIEAINRVQNRKLWRIFKNEVKDVKKKNEDVKKKDGNGNP
jgi:hypothetical protein